MIENNKCPALSMEVAGYTFINLQQNINAQFDSFAMS